MNGPEPRDRSGVSSSYGQSGLIGGTAETDDGRMLHGASQRVYLPMYVGE